jgi:hypothetical protein
VTVRRILSFASLTLLTQMMLLIHQLAVLPAQIHLWDHAMTARWYEAISLAAITGVADLGLRGAGHVELLRLVGNPQDTAAHEQFRQIWAWIRILVGLVTFGVVLLDCAIDGYSGRVAVWRIALITAGGLETILAIRVFYLDSLGWYNRAESVFALYAVARLVASLVALTVFGAREGTLAAIYLISVAMALVFQSIVCRQVAALRLVGGLPLRPSTHVLASARHTIASPLALWIQIQFPVIILSVIASPLAVTTYVTLRAIFGVARQTVQQISRAASVEYVRLSRGELRPGTEAVISVVMIAVSCIGAWLACLVLVESQPIARFIGVESGMEFFRAATLAFGLTGSFLSYQISVGVMMRLGSLAEIAWRQYLYVFLSIIGALTALITRMPEFYLLLNVGAEVVMAVLMLANAPYKTGASSVRSGRRAMIAAVVSAGSVLLIWVAGATEPSFSFSFPAGLNMAGGAAIVAIDIAVIAALQAFMNRDLYRFVPRDGRHA